MSRTLTSPWIKKSIQQILFNAPSNSRKSPEKINRICQVIQTFENFRCIVVSDKDHFIPLFLTDAAIALLLRDNISIRSIGNAIVKLETYHFSTIYQCAGDRNIPALANEISRPLAIQCSKLVFLGGDDCTTIGDPICINKEFEHQLSQMPYMAIVENLRSKQFPSQKCLPDYAYRFSSFVVFDDNSPLTIEDCLISTRQFEFISSLPSFSHSDLILAHSSRMHIKDGDLQESQGQLFDSQNLQYSHILRNPAISGHEETTDNNLVHPHIFFTQNDLDYSEESVAAAQKMIESAKQSRANKKSKPPVNGRKHLDDFQFFTQADINTQNFDEEYSQFSQMTDNFSVDNPKLSQEFISLFNNITGTVDANTIPALDNSPVNLQETDDVLISLLQPPSPHAEKIHNWVSAKVGKTVGPANSSSYESQSRPQLSRGLPVQKVADNSSSIVPTQPQDQKPILLWTVPTFGTIKGINENGFIFESSDGSNITTLSFKQLESMFAANSAQPESQPPTVPPISNVEHRNPDESISVATGPSTTSPELSSPKILAAPANASKQSQGGATETSSADRKPLRGPLRTSATSRKAAIGLANQNSPTPSSSKATPTVSNTSLGSSSEWLTTKRRTEINLEPSTERPSKKANNTASDVTSKYSLPQNLLSPQNLTPNKPNKPENAKLPVSYSVEQLVSCSPNTLSMQVAPRKFDYRKLMRKYGQG